MTTTEREPSELPLTAGGDALVVIENLTRHFRLGHRASARIVRAVDDVSLTLMRGETLGLVGESGSGKSTLARLVLRLDQPTSGRVHFDARDVFASSARELRRLRRRCRSSSRIRTHP